MKVKIATRIIKLSLSYLFFRRPKHQSGAPQQVSYHDVFILTPTVVRVEVEVDVLAEPMYFKEVMEHAYHHISTLAHVNSLIDEVVDLARYGFTAYSKDGTFPWGEEVHGTQLEGVVRVEHLLGHVK